MTHEVVEELADELERAHGDRAIDGLFVHVSGPKMMQIIRALRTNPPEQDDCDAMSIEELGEFVEAHRTPATGEVGELPTDLPLFCLQAMKVQLATFGVEPACNADGAIAVASSQAAEIARLQSALNDVLARDAEWGLSGAPNDCGCIRLSAQGEGEYEAGTCPHQRARAALSGSNSDAG